MDLHYRQEITVGALVLTGVAAFVLGTMWLSGRESRSGRRMVDVEFADVGNMKRGNPVKVSGVQLGTVQEIAFEDVGRVRVTLNLDPRIQPKTDASARLGAVGLVGDVVILFDPGRAAEPLPPGAILKGTTERGLMDIGSSLSDEASATMASLREVANKDLAQELRKTLQSFQRLANNYADPKSGPAGELTGTMAELRKLTTRLDSILASPGLGRVVANADTATARFGRLAEQFTATSARVDTLLLRINRGEGTVGKLVTDTTMYAQLRDLSASLKAFIDDLRKNPGKIPIQVKIF